MVILSGIVGARCVQGLSEFLPSKGEHILHAGFLRISLSSAPKIIQASFDRRRFNFFVAIPFQALVEKRPEIPESQVVQNHLDSRTLHTG
jgi:hypothetical protein